MIGLPASWKLTWRLSAAPPADGVLESQVYCSRQRFDLQFPWFHLLKFVGSFPAFKYGTAIRCVERVFRVAQIGFHEILERTRSFIDGRTRAGQLQFQFLFGQTGAVVSFRCGDGRVVQVLSQFLIVARIALVVADEG